MPKPIRPADKPADKKEEKAKAPKKATKKAKKDDTKKDEMKKDDIKKDDMKKWALHPYFGFRPRLWSGFFLLRTPFRSAGGKSRRAKICCA